MKKTCIFLLLYFLLSNLTTFADSLDDITDVSKMWDGQKTITNKEFEQVMDALQEKQKKKEAKANKKKIKKISGGGESLYKEMSPDKDIKELQAVKKNEDGVLLNIPVQIQLGNKILERGFYKVYAERDENQKPFISFYQSQFFMGKVEAYETTEDFDKDTLDFVEITPYNDSFMKIIFGSLDFNAYAYVPYVE